LIFIFSDIFHIMLLAAWLVLDYADINIIVDVIFIIVAVYLGPAFHW